MKNLIPNEFPFPEYEPKTYADVLLTCIKMNQYLREHDSIAVSVSGGSDSDCIVHLVCKYFPEYLNKIRFVFVNTGLEYDATKRHLCDLEKRYGIKIERIRGKSVVYVCKKYGFPILSKIKSHFLNLYLREVPCGEKYVIGDGVKTYHAMQFTENQKTLAKFLKENDIMISKKCCDLSKKQPLKEFQKSIHADLYVTGERKQEGGQRAMQQTCFRAEKTISKYMPLFWWNDETKQDFKTKEGLVFSDCYEVWGMKRTGCVGCPFNLNIGDDLEKMWEYEPKMFIACMNVFGLSYFLMDKFACRRKKCISDKIKLVLNTMKGGM